MDVLTLDLIRSASMRGGGRDDRPEDGRRRRIAMLIERLVGGLRSGGAGGDAISRRRSRLLAFTAATVVVGVGLLAITSVTSAPWQAIDPGIRPGTVLSGPTGGLLLWLLYGLLGSLRVLRAPGGGAMTFHLPFVGAAMILGGPTAGAWVAFLSTIERRELETQPWYGILANHATLVVGAVVGGIAVQVVTMMLPADAGGGGLLVAATVGAIVLAVISTAIGAVTVMLREDLSARAMAEILLGQVGRMTAIECALIVVLALAYLQVGWWAPLLVAGFVLVVWDNHPLPPLDIVTGLPGREATARRLESAVGRMRRGVTPWATVLLVDLDSFKAINDNHGLNTGDEVLAEVGRRLARQARRSEDLAGRWGGDEFVLFLPGLGDPELSVRRADEIVADLCRPYVTAAGVMTIGASVGVVVVQAWGGVPSSETLIAQGTDAMHIAKDAGGGSHLYHPDDPRISLGNRRG
jgi:diguanylate cyclase (GGDEF)-like protein